MKRCRRGLSLVLAGVMALSSVSPCLAAGVDTVENAAPFVNTAPSSPDGSALPPPVRVEDPATGNIRVSGMYRYPSAGGQDYMTPYFYDDDYFTRSAYEYQDSLATMTLSVALTAFGSARARETAKGYTQKSINLYELLVQCGFPAEHYDTNEDFRTKPTRDSIGVGVSYKTIREEGQPCTLIAAAIRGGAYESEWASNFTMGQSGAHRGFSEARDQVLAYLREYIEAQGIQGSIKLWITGYSRAAATTNMVAGALDSGASLGEQVTLDGEDLFAYCFECPQGAAPDVDVDDPVYGNIFNIINPGDLVTKIGPGRPASFGFQRYGVNRYLPTALKEGEDYGQLQGAMLEQFHALPSPIQYTVDDFQMKRLAPGKIFWDPQGAWKDGIIVDNPNEKWDLNAFLDEFIYRFFVQCVQSRDNYVDCYEAGIREMCFAAFGCGDRWPLFAQCYHRNMLKNLPELMYYMVHQDAKGLTKLVERVLDETLSETGITDYTPREIAQFTNGLVQLFLLFGMCNPNLTVTAVVNLSPIATAHFPEVCMAWLQSFDPNFTPEGKAAFNSGIHRVVRVHGDADVQVSDAQGQLVAAIQDGESQPIPGSDIVSFVNEAEEKLVYLPAAEGYRIDVLPGEEGSVSYTVHEYSEEAGGVNRIENYYDLSAGESYTGLLPAVSAESLESDRMDGTSAVYDLRSEDGRLTADDSLRGQEAADANCRVSVTANRRERGVVLGDTMVKQGGWARVQAIPSPGCRFVGWYEDGQLVSRDAVHDLCVKEDTELVGRFAIGPKIVKPGSWESDFRWSEDFGKCTAVFTSDKGAEKRLPCRVRSVTTPAADGQDGEIVYTASVVFRGKRYTDTKTVVLPFEEEPVRRPWWEHWFPGV